MHTDRDEGRVQRVYTNVLPAATMFQASISCNITNWYTIEALLKGALLGYIMAYEECAQTTIPCHD